HPLCPTVPPARDRFAVAGGCRRRSGPPIKVVVGAVGLVLALIAIGCGGSSSTSSTRTSRLLGTLAKPATLAYPLRLKDSLGHEVNIRDYRGKAVLLTFIYTLCPDVCPLIVGHLHAAQSELRAEASHLQIIAVSVDPRGDTPKAVNA